MSAYGRKQPFGPSLNRRSLTSAFEKKADIRVLYSQLELNGKVRPKRDIRVSQIAKAIPCYTTTRSSTTTLIEFISSQNGDALRPRRHGNGADHESQCDDAFNAALRVTCCARLN